MRFLRTISYTLLVVFSLFTSALAAEPELGAYGSVVDPSGNITLPENYRSEWSHMGSWVVADPEAPGHGFHDVYMQPGAVEYYRKTGRFADGAVIVKEVRKLASGAKTTGQAQWAGDINIWFVMVKDSNERFKGNPHWANGWGWALFENKAPDKNVSEGFSATCQSCHLPAKDQDWVFTEGYPTLTESPNTK